MNKTIKVIDLLIMVANNEEVPKKFAYTDDENVRYIFDLELDGDYWSKELNGHFFENYFIPSILNDEIEIIEEIEFESIEEFVVPLEYSINGGIDKASEEYRINQLIKNQRKLIKAVNELKEGK